MCDTGRREGSGERVGGCRHLSGCWRQRCAAGSGPRTSIGAVGTLSSSGVGDDGRALGSSGEWWALGERCALGGRRPASTGALADVENLGARDVADEVCGRTSARKGRVVAPFIEILGVVAEIRATLREVTLLRGRGSRRIDR